MNEETKIARDVTAAGEFISENLPSGEIIVVDDGSTDNTAETARSAAVSPDVPVRVIRYGRHRGKGYAVRAGIAASEGDFVMFADSGLCVPYDYVLKGLELIADNQADIAHGSRKLPDSVITTPQPLRRRVIARIFRQVFIRFLGIPSRITDTQCGFKIYRGDAAREIYRSVQTDGFLFDIEVILAALSRDLRIKEFPVKWTTDPDSRLAAMKNGIVVMQELIAIKRRINRNVNH